MRTAELLDNADVAITAIEGLLPAGAADSGPTARQVIESIAPGDRVTLACESSTEALMTCMFVAFARKSAVEDVCLGSYIQPRLGQNVVAVSADMQAALRVKRSIQRSLGSDVWHAVMLACSTDDPAKPQALLRFLTASLTDARTGHCKRCERRDTCAHACSRIPSNNLLDQWSHPDIEPLLALYRQAINEIDRMRQFVRFEQVERDLWFARCNPSCSVVPYLMGHFARRFNTQRFVIYDEVHHMAGLSEQGRWQLVEMDSVEFGSAVADEALAQSAWKRFYQAVSIDERYHPELRRNFMPKRLWKNITEMQVQTATPC